MLHRKNGQPEKDEIYGAEGENEGKKVSWLYLK